MKSIVSLLLAIAALTAAGCAHRDSTSTTQTQTTSSQSSYSK
jgi:hypothetical protein